MPLLALILPLLLSVISLVTIIPTPIQLMVFASVEDDTDDEFDDKENTRDEDDGDDGDSGDDIDLDEMRLLQICCAWSDKISDGVWNTE